MKALLTGLGLFFVFGLLMVVVYPIFRPIDHTARNAQLRCRSNERQLGLAFAQYTDDNDQIMPNISDAPGSKSTWRAAIFPYVKSMQVYQCPSRTTGALNTDGYPVSYAANDCGPGGGAFGDPGSKPVSVADFAAPKNLIVLCEVENETGPAFNIEDTVTFGPGKNVLWAGHSGGSDYLLADGHAKSMLPTQTAKLWYRDSKKTLSAGAQSILDDAEKRFAP